MSSYYDDASLMLLASGGAQKDGKVYSVKPTDGSGDFTFTRGSNLSATRVDASQLIEKGRENLFLQSQDFATTWGKSAGITLTGGQPDPFGGNAAFLVNLGASVGNSIVQSVSLSSGVQYTMSAYIKGVDLTSLRMIVAGNSSTLVTSQIVNGTWVRVVVTGVAGGTGFLTNQIVRSNNTLSQSLFIYGAQIELGGAASDYIETGATTAQAGILENTPRFDYSGGATCPSLLLEPSRSNGNVNSEYFNGAGFGIVAATATDNATTSPEGVINATSLIGSTSSAEHIIYTTGSSTYNGDTTISIFAKVNGYDYFVLGAGAQSANKPVLFNIANGTKVGNFTGWSSYSAPIDSDIEDYGNGWYRLSVTFAATSGINTNMFFGSMPTDSVASGTTIQNGTDGSYIYGASIEAGSYSTSYIPTYGVSQTRANEDCEIISAASLIGQTEGTAYAEINHIQGTESLGVFMNNGSGSNYGYLVAFYISSGNIPIFVINNNTGQVSIQGTTPLNSGTHKLAIAYKENDFALYVNGVQIGTDSSGTIPALNDLYIGQYKDNVARNGNKKQVLLFKTRLSNLDLAILTGATTYNTFAEMALALNYTVYE